jgi:hypothetical protein
VGAQLRATVLQRGLVWGAKLRDEVYLIHMILEFAVGLRTTGKITALLKPIADEGGAAPLKKSAGMTPLLALTNSQILYDILAGNAHVARAFPWYVHSRRPQKSRIITVRPPAKKITKFRCWLVPIMASLKY